MSTAELLSRVTEPHLRKSRGNLLFVSSIAGLEVIGAPTDYSMAKAALLMFAKQLSHKLAPEVRVNCIAPGNIFLRVAVGQKSVLLIQILWTRWLNRRFRCKDLEVPKTLLARRRFFAHLALNS